MNQDSAITRMVSDPDYRGICRTAMQLHLFSFRYEHAARRLRAKPRQTTQRTRPGVRQCALPGVKIAQGMITVPFAPAGTRRGARCAFPLGYEHAGGVLSAQPRQTTKSARTRERRRMLSGAGMRGWRCPCQMNSSAAASSAASSSTPRSAASEPPDAPNKLWKKQKQEKNLDSWPVSKPSSKFFVRAAHAWRPSGALRMPSGERR